MTRELIDDLRAEADGCRDQDGPGSATAVLLDRAADVLEARQPHEDDREALARVMDELAYYHCRSVNPKADHPRMGYHAMTEDQREHLRESQRDAAEEIVRMLPSLSRAAVPDAATEELEVLKDIAETHALCADRLSIEKERADRVAREVCDRGCSYTGGPDEECSAHGRTPRELWEFIAQDVVGRDAATERAEKAEAERDAALAAIERVQTLADFWNDTPDYQPSEYDKGRVDQRHAMTEQLLAALDGAPEPAGLPVEGESK